MHTIPIKPISSKAPSRHIEQGRRSVLRLMLGGAAGISQLAWFGATARAQPSDALTRILVVGDSQAQGLAAGLQRLFRNDDGYRIIERSRIGTGLIPRPRYDWPAAITTIAAGEHADVAVVMFGANDRPNVWVGGQVDPKLDARFRDSYTASVRTIVRALRNTHAAVIWVGHPIVREARFAKDMCELNEIFSAVATEEGAIWVPLWDVFAGPDGQYAAYGHGVDGQTTRLRADDGVHLTAAGYDVAAALLRAPIEASRAPPQPLRNAAHRA